MGEQREPQHLSAQTAIRGERGLMLFAQPVFPVCRFAMQISYGDDQYLVLRVSVYDAIGETFRLATPCPFRTRMPCRWKSRDAIEGVKDFRQKLVAQARHFSVVKFDCF